MHQFCGRGFARVRVVHRWTPAIPKPDDVHAIVLIEGPEDISGDPTGQHRGNPRRDSVASELTVLEFDPRPSGDFSRRKTILAGAEHRLVRRRSIGKSNLVVDEFGPVDGVFADPFFDGVPLAACLNHAIERPTSQCEDSQPVGAPVGLEYTETRQ